MQDILTWYIFNQIKARICAKKEIKGFSTFVHETKFIDLWAGNEKTEFSCCLTRSALEFSLLLFTPSPSSSLQASRAHRDVDVELFDHKRVLKPYKSLDCMIKINLIRHYSPKRLCFILKEMQ